jgi:predicted Fe-Mo cluster-binding NifX family protein
MKIAVTTSAPDLQAQIDPRFGRCPYFLIVETDDLSFEAVENPNLGLSSGAGIQSAQLLAERGVKQVLTGNCGPNAHSTLSAAAGVGEWAAVWAEEWAAEWVAGWEAAEAEYFLSGQAPFPLNLLPA